MDNSRFTNAFLLQPIVQSHCDLLLAGNNSITNTKSSQNLEELKRQDKVNNADSVFVFLAILFISRNGQIQMAYMALTDKCILKIHVKM